MALKKKTAKFEEEVKLERESGEKVLRRSNSDKMIAGVAGGLAEYFGIDASIVRVIFVLVTLLGGSGVLAYLILWLILPKGSKSAMGEEIEENVEEIKDKAREWVAEVKDGGKEGKNKKVIGVILLVLGVIFLMQNLGWWFFDWSRMWPVFLIVLGLVVLIRRK
jgi:phage shock protein C